MIKDVLEKLDSYEKSILSQQEAVEADIHVAYKELQQVPDNTKNKLIREVDQEIQKSLKSLAVEKRQLETVLVQLDSCLLFVRESLRPGNEEDVLTMKAMVVNQIQELTSLTFTESDSTAVGKSFSSILSDYSKCHFTNEAAATGELPPFLSAITTKDKPSCEIPTIMPKRKLAFEVISDVKNPGKVVITQRAEVVVMEGGKHCISVFSLSGKKLHSFGSYGKSEGKLDWPSGIALDGDGNILVTDENNHRIQKFTAKGRFLASAGIKGSAPLQFMYPRGIAWNPKSKKVYVADRFNHRVQVINSDFTFSSRFGMAGSGRGKFGDPWDVACDSTGNVYVVDNGSHCIQVFTAEGRYLQTFGGRGQEKGKLARPSGIAIDCKDMVYVSELGNHRISVFTLLGHFQLSYGKEEAVALKYPAGLAVDSSGALYVCDYDKHEIKIIHSCLP